MQNLALDTNAYRGLSDGNQVLAGAFRAATAIGMPVVVLGELYDGFFNGNKTDQNLAQHIDLWQNELTKQTISAQSGVTSYSWLSRA